MRGRWPRASHNHVSNPNQTGIMKKQLHLFLLTGWLIPVALALLFFGLWIIDIVIPTLKGNSFDQLYDFHQFRYLDSTLGCISVALVWLTLVVIRWARISLRAA